MGTAGREEENKTEKRRRIFAWARHSLGTAPPVYEAPAGTWISELI